MEHPAKPKSKTPRAKPARGAPKFGFNDQYLATPGVEARKYKGTTFVGK
jgi:hypothetical protein